MAICRHLPRQKRTPVKDKDVWAWFSVEKHIYWKKSGLHTCCIFLLRHPLLTCKNNLNLTTGAIIIVQTLQKINREILADCISKIFGRNYNHNIRFWKSSSTSMLRFNPNDFKAEFCSGRTFPIIYDVIVALLTEYNNQFRSVQN